MGIQEERFWEGETKANREPVAERPLLDWPFINQQSFRFGAGGEQSRLPRLTPRAARAAGSTDRRVFPIAAIFNRENSIQNFPCFQVSLFIYFNSLLLLFARGNQRLPAPAAGISEGSAVSLSPGVLPPEQGAHLPSLLCSQFADGNSESCAALRPPVPPFQTSSFLSLSEHKKRHLEAFLTSAKGPSCAHTGASKKAAAFQKKKRSFHARLLCPWAGPLREVAPATSEATDLACQERTIYRKGRLYFSFVALSVPGPTLARCTSQELARGAEREKAQWLPLTPHLATTNAPL